MTASRSYGLDANCQGPHALALTIATARSPALNLPRIFRRDGPTAVPDQQPPDANTDPRLNVDAGRLHLVVTPLELDIVVDALRSVGNSELAERFEAILRLSGYGADQS